MSPPNPTYVTSQSPVADPLEAALRLPDLLDAFPKPCFFFQREASTVMGCDAFETMTLRGLGVTLDRQGDLHEVPGSPYAAISEWQKKYQRALPQALLTLPIGAFGFLAYESARFAEPILNASFTKFSKTDQDDGYLVICRRFIVIDHKTKLVHYVADSPSTLATLEAQATQALNKIAGKAQDATDEEIPVEHFKAKMGRDQFVKAALAIKDHIGAGDIFQAVLSERFDCELPVSALQLFKALLKTAPAPYRFYLAAPNGQEYLGASPEMLLTVVDGVMETHPIAGTRPRGKTPDEDKRFEKQLHQSPKENAEHLMLVDLARNDLGRIAEPGSVSVPERMVLKKFSSVMHLVSRVTGRLKAGCTSMEALASCFPAGTLSGAPKIRAMQILAELEHQHRGFYGGAVVLASFNGDLDSCISIRSLKAEGCHAVIQAGAGIVADSQPEREYQEVCHKTRALRRAIAYAKKNIGELL